MRHGFVARHFNEELERARREQNRQRQENRAMVNGNAMPPVNRDLNQLANQFLQLDPNEDDINLEQAENMFVQALQVRQDINIMNRLRHAVRQGGNEPVPQLVEESDSEDEFEQNANERDIGHAQRLRNNRNNVVPRER